MSKPLPQEPEFEPLSRIQILAAMGVTAILLLLVARIWLWLDDGMILEVQLSVSAIALGVGIGLGITVASSLVYQLWPAYQYSADLYLKLVLKPLIWPDLVWLGILPGLSEELLFRGVMLPALGFNGLAVVVSSLCFGVLHFSGVQQWPYVIWATAVGAVLGFSALETGNLLIPIVAHMTTNMVSSLLWKLEG
ncbi:MAG TPA: CPBP family intramembrane glutamic endopeptidase [Candidatus Obscuribacterales bacterium]